MRTKYKDIQNCTRERKTARPHRYVNKLGKPTTNKVEGKYYAQRENGISSSKLLLLNDTVNGKYYKGIQGLG